MRTAFRTAIGDTPTVRVLETLIEGRELDHSLTDIAEQSHVGWTTLHRIWPHLERLRIVKQTRTVGRAKMFILNAESPIAQQLIRLFDTIVKEHNRLVIVA